MAKHENQGGLTLETEQIASGATCAVCGRPCGAAFGGVPMHIPCFWSTTAASVQQLHDAAMATTKQQQPRAPEAQPQSESEGERVVVPAWASQAPATDPRLRESGTARSALKRTSGRRAPGERFVGPAAVLSADTVFLPGGVTRGWSPAEVTHLGDLATLAVSLGLGWGGGEDRFPDIAQLWLTEDALEVLGLPVSMPEDDQPRKKALTKAAKHDLVVKAGEAGWEVGRVEVWTRIWHPETFRRGAFIVALPWTRVEGVPLYEDDPVPGELADRLRRFAEATGVSYRLTPASTGLDVIDHYRPPRRSQVDTLGQSRGRVAVMLGAAGLPPFLHDSATDTRIANLEADYSWHRPYSRLLDEERGRRYVHAYDRNASYLAPWSNIDLGVEGLTHQEGIAAVWDGSKKPGYFLVDEWDWPHWGLPDPGNATYGRMAEGRVWVTSHTLEQLSWHGVTPAVHESYTWQTSARYLDRANKVMVEARKTLDPADPVLNTLKGMYSATVGKLGQREHRPDYHLWRPDWRHHIIAATRTAILYTLMQNAQHTAQAFPVMVDRDLIVYTCDEPDPIKAWPGEQKKLTGTSPGGWKPAGTALLSEWGPTWLVDPPKQLRGNDAAQALKNGGETT